MRTTGGRIALVAVLALAACHHARNLSTGNACTSDSQCAAPETCGGGGTSGTCGCPEHTYYEDADHDGYGNDATATMSCTPVAGEVTQGGDCNDADPTVNPGRTEICDYKDNNCNGLIDENATTTYYRDGDGDGYGDPSNTVTTCGQPGGFVSVGGDCDDSRPDVNPGAIEQCNNRDDNCDGIIDGETRSCGNDCGTGTETCTAGVFQGCDAPVETEITVPTTLNGNALSFACLHVESTLTLSADTHITATNWIMLDKNSSIIAGPRLTLQAGGDITFSDNASMSTPEITITSGGTVHLDGDSRWTIANYSGAGNAACSDGSARGSSGGSGGSRGGDGGRGGSCGELTTAPISGVDDTGAINGSAGCDCACSDITPGGGVSGGGGGAALSGGGGGGNGGAGGTGGAGNYNGTAYAAGIGGASEPVTGEPTYGGAGGGASGTIAVSYAPEACQSRGGNGGGLLHIDAVSFDNDGLVFVDGVAGVNASGSTGTAGGGAGGAGGTVVLHVDQFNNLGGISASGASGGSGIAPCNGTTKAGGGGGGGGGRIYITGHGKAAVVSTLGNTLVGAGAGGAGGCGGPSGSAGQPGVVTTN